MALRPFIWASLLIAPIALATGAPAPERKIPISRQLIDDSAAYQRERKAQSLSFLRERIGASIASNPHPPGSALYFIERASSEMWRRYLDRDGVMLDPYWDHPVEAPLLRDRSLSPSWRSAPHKIPGYTSLIEGEYLWALAMRVSHAPSATVAVMSATELVEPIRAALLEEAMQYRNPLDVSNIITASVASCMVQALTISAFTDAEMAHYNLSPYPLEEVLLPMGAAEGADWRSTWGFDGTRAVIHHTLKIPGGYLVARETSLWSRAHVRHYAAIPMLRSFAAAVTPVAI